LKIISKTYNSIEVLFHSELNSSIYINATKVAKQFNKKPVDWLKTNETQTYIQAVSKIHNITYDNLVITKKGGNNLKEQGTWIHKKLIIFFARWLSPEFAVWCDTQIEEILKTGSYQIQPKNDISELENSLKITKIASQFLDIFHKKNKLQLLYLDNFVKSETGNSIIEKFGIGLKNQFFLPTELGNFIGKSGMEINQIFANFGFQEKINGVWKLLERGQEFGSVFQNGSNLQIKWKLSVLEKI